MPPKANKIATAIAAVNRTVVKNYNAANRAVNRAPAWVKWTIAAIAVAIIGYALWKVFFAGKKEGFQTYTDQPGFPDEGEEALAYGQTMSLRQMGGDNFFWDITIDQAKAECDRLGAECTGFASNGSRAIFMKGGYKINTQNTGWNFYKKEAAAVVGEGGAAAATTATVATTDAGRKMESTVIEQITLKNLGSDFGPIQNVESSGKCQILASEKISEGVTGYVFDKSTNTCLLKRFAFSNMSADKGSEVNQNTTSGVFPYAITDWPVTHSPFMFKSIMDATQFEKKDTKTLLEEYNKFFETKIPSGSKFYLKTKDPINGIHYHYHTGPDKNEIVVAQDFPRLMEEWFSYHYDDGKTYSHIKNSDNTGNMYLVSNTDGPNTWLEMSTDTTKPKDWVIVHVQGTKYYHIKNKNTMYGFEPEKGYVTYFGGLRGKDSEFGAGGLKISTTPYEWEIVFSSS